MERFVVTILCALRRMVHLALVATLGSALSLGAQGVPVAIAQEERVGRAAERRLEQLEEEVEVDPLDDATPVQRVRYSDVLRDPDNVELNYRWALTQLQDKNLKGAAATLERMLLVRPNLARVRMLYGVVLLRMGDLEHARREFEALEDLPMNARSRAQLDQYQEQIKRSRRVYRSVLTMNVGAHTDSNRNSGPDSNQALVANVRRSVGSASKKTADQGWSSILNLKIERDLGYQEDTRAVLGLTYFHSQQEDLDQLDIQVGKFDLGVSVNRGGWELEPKLVVDVIDLSRQVYQRSVGAQLLAQVPVSNKLDASLNLRSVYEDYDSTPDATTARDRTGYRSDLKFDFGFRPWQRHRFTFKSAIARKSAQKTYLSSLTWEGGISHLWILPTGQFLISSIQVKREKFHRNQNSIGDSRRRDLQSTARVVLGIPLQSIFRKSKALRGATLTLSAEAVHADSNIPSNEYNNHKFGFSLSKRMDW